MRSIQLITGALAVVATSSLIGLGSAAVASDTTTTRERGNLLECTGTHHGRPVYASLYENSRYGNTIQILVGDDDHQVGGSRDGKPAFVDGRNVRGTLQIGGSRAVVEGVAHKVGKRIAVHEVHDDAGQHIIVNGYHRRLANDLTLTWKGRTVPLDCDNAFAYDLQVTKSPIE